LSACFDRPTGRKGFGQEPTFSAQQGRAGERTDTNWLVRSDNQDDMTGSDVRDEF